MRTQAKRYGSGANERTVRASISFPEDQYQIMERIAAENKVSLAWVVRDAINGYLKSRWPPLQQDSDTEVRLQQRERS